MGVNGLRNLPAKPVSGGGSTPRKWGAERQGSGFDFGEVDGHLLLAALHVCVAANCSVQIGAARGGFGVAVQPYQHPTRYETLFAADAERFKELLWSLIDEFSSPSEDIAALWELTR